MIIYILGFLVEVSIINWNEICLSIHTKTKKL